MRILVTGFDPFGGETINPAIEAVKKLPNRIAGAEIIKLEIPTVFDKSALIVNQMLGEERIDYVLHIGQAGGRAALTPERIAINLDDARIPDNEGNQPIDEPIIPEGESAYFSQLPIKAMVSYMKEEDLPASISNTAGTFVCNHIMYQTLHQTHTNYPQVKAGFMHIPFLPEQVLGQTDLPSLTLAEIVRGVEASLRAIIDYDGQDDLKIVGGKIH